MEATEVILKTLNMNARFLDIALSGLTDEQLNESPDPESNPAGWLWWHKYRVEDNSIAHGPGDPAVWTEGGWPEKFGLDIAPGDLGIGHTPEKARSLKFRKKDLAAYAETVREKTAAALGAMSPENLDREIPDIVPDQTIRVGEFLGRSLTIDNFHHSGQICYLRGHLTGFGWAPI